MFISHPLHCKVVHRPIVSDLYNKLFGIIFKLLIDPTELQKINLMFENFELESTTNLFEIWIPQAIKQETSFKEYNNDIKKYYVCLKPCFLESSSSDLLEYAQQKNIFIIQNKDNIFIERKLETWTIPTISEDPEIFDDKYNEFYDIFYKENPNDENFDSKLNLFLSNFGYTLFKSLKNHFFLAHIDNRNVIYRLFDNDDFENKIIETFSIKNKHINIEYDPLIKDKNENAIKNFFEGGE